MTKKSSKISNEKNQDFSELIQFLGEKFDTVDQRFNSMDQRFDKVDQRFELMDRRFDKVEQRLDRVEQDVVEVKADVQWMKENSSELFVKLDRFIALYEKQEQETLMLGAQLRRLEDRVARLEANKS